MTHTLPNLPYSTDALEPYLDRQTMELHYTKHHAGYVKNLNAALENHPDLRDKGVEDLLRALHTLPPDIRTAVRNNGGGHANHSMFWLSMSPRGSGQPTGTLADAIGSAFGSFESFKDEFFAEAMRRFGSGWVWLSRSGGPPVDREHAESGQPVDGRQDAALRARRLGARLLLEVSESSGGLRQSVVACSRLGGDRQAARRA